MKMVKSLLLGSAAGLVAVAGAQAADLPVKAKAVEYVKVCSIYGAGFWYVPGTDICMKVGGYVRAQYYDNMGSSPSNGILTNASGLQTRTSQNDYVTRARYLMSIDTRQQTEYGTVRTYMIIGASSDGPANSPVVSGGGGATGGNGAFGALYSNRGFIQFAGFTFGKTQSYFDLFSGPAVSYFGTFSEDTGDGGKMVAAYTAQFGGGFSATISAEDPRRSEVLNTSAGVLGIVNAAQINAIATQDVGVRFPDVVAALRYDQSWGSLQVMGAIHDASGGYYGSAAVPSTLNGHPSDTIGWAVGGGAVLQTPFITQGDFLQVETNYSQGAIGYNIAANNSLGGGYFLYKGGQSAGLGLLVDSVYGCTNAVGAGAACVVGPGGVVNGTSVQLTSVWSINASYDHFWTPALRTSLYGGFFDVRYNNVAAALIDGGMATGNPSAFLNGNPNNQIWQIGSRSQWNITPAFYLGVDVLYTQLNTGFGGPATLAPALPQPGSAALTGVMENQSAWSFTFRAHRDFLP